MISTETAPAANSSPVQPSLQAEAKAAAYHGARHLHLKYYSTAESLLLRALELMKICPLKYSALAADVCDLLADLYAERKDKARSLHFIRRARRLRLEQALQVAVTESIRGEQRC